MEIRIFNVYIDIYTVLGVLNCLPGLCLFLNVFVCEHVWVHVKRSGSTSHVITQMLFTLFLYRSLTSLEHP